VDPLRTAASLKQAWRDKKLIVDWKSDTPKSVDVLDRMLGELNKNDFEVYVKVPASYLCKNNQGKPLILGLQNVKRVIVEMYGEEIGIYKRLDQMFTME